MSKVLKSSSDFKPNYRIAKLSALGILGFILGCVFLFYPESGEDKKSIFHEILYTPKGIVSKPIEESIPFVESQSRKLSIEKKTNVVLLNTSTKKDSLNERNAAIDEQLAVNKKDLEQLKSYKNSYDQTSLADTSSYKRLNNALHFQINYDSIYRWDSRFVNHNDTAFVTSHAFKDPNISFSLLGSDTLTVKKYSSDVEFITKYPSAGIWLLLVLSYCSFLFIAISTSIYLKNKIVELFKFHDIKGLSTYDYYWVSLFTFLTLLLLSTIWKKTFYDDEIIKSLFFIKSLNVSMRLIIVLGYLGGSFCLAGFIHTAAMLSYFAKNIKTKTTVISQKKEEIIKQVDKISKENQLAGSDMTEQQATEISNNQNTLDEEQEKHSKDKIIIESLVSFFNSYFVLSAIILSLMVLCTGALFSTINSLDFVKLLEDDWGYSPVRTDFIYLYGGLYTIILLLVYIPAKMRFSEINVATEGGGEIKTQTSNGKWYEFLKNPFGQFKDVLIAASPLLASLIQSLFDLIFN